MLYLICAWISHGILSNVTITSLYKQASIIIMDIYALSLMIISFIFTTFLLN